MMMSALYLTNTLSCMIFIVLAQSEGRHVAPLGHDILIVGQQIFTLSP